MPEMFIYLIKANVAIVLFYAGYRLLLRKLTFYNLNRYYLIFALFFSALYPLVDLNGWFAGQQVAVADVAYVLPVWQEVPVEQSNPWWYASLAIWAVAGFFGLRMLVRLVSLWAIHRRSHPAHWRMFHYRQVFGQAIPFSFWRTIYLDVRQHESRELEDIFNHEQVHVDELHTVDILLAEICSVLCWFNPGAWLLRHAVRENLEFITDRRVLQNGVDKTAYQYSLLHINKLAGTNPGMVNNFNFKGIKRRIMMMNKRDSSQLQLGKYVLAIPVITVLVLVFTLTKAYQADADAGAAVELGDAGQSLESRAVAGADSTVSVAITLDEAFALDGSPMYQVDGESQTKEFVRRLDAQEVAQVSFLKGSKVVELFGPEAAEGVVRITTRSGRARMQYVLDGQPLERGIDWLGRIDGSQIASIEIRKGDSGPGEYSDGTMFITTRSGSGGLKPAGPASPATADSVRLDVRVIGQDGAGEPADRTVHVQQRLTLRGVSADSTGRKPLIVLDGITTNENALNQLNPDQIEHISVLRDNSATALYGDKGKHGVILIATKVNGESVNGASSGTRVTLKGDSLTFDGAHNGQFGGHDDTMVFTPSRRSVASHVTGTDTNSIRHDLVVVGTVTPVSSEPTADFQGALILIDGERATAAELRALSPNEIKHISVLKGESATEKYGDKGKNGAVEVELVKK